MKTNFYGFTESIGFNPATRRQAISKKTQLDNKLNAGATLGMLKKLFAELTAAERAASTNNAPAQTAIAARAKYQAFYDAEIIGSKNPIIMNLYAA